MSNKYIWLASYPKSGNTWLRYLIANYFFNKDKNFNHNIFKKVNKFPQADHLPFVKKSEIFEDPYNIAKYWIKGQKELKPEGGNVAFLKTHTPLVTINNNSFTNESLSLAIIHVVRDPRDIVVSYSKFMNENYEKTIDRMIADKLTYVFNKSDPLDIEIIGSWKFHYNSWKKGIKSIPRILIRYEDLLSNTLEEFKKILSFLSKILNFEINEDQLNFCVEASSFTNLSKYEKKYGFKEASKHGGFFFRKGIKDQWKQELSKSNIQIIEKELKAEMKLLEYL